jgi:hypothetical protein
MLKKINIFTHLLLKNVIIGENVIIRNNIRPGIPNINRL